MAQDFQLIGSLSPDAEHINDDPSGWQGENPEPMNVEQTEHSWSFRHQISNTRALGLYAIDNMAGYVDEPPMAGMPVQPW